MSTVDQPTLYDDLLELFAVAANKEKLLSFRLPADKQQRLDDLLERNRDNRLTPEEHQELEEFERLEHLGRILKARARQLGPS